MKWCREVVALIAIWSITGYPLVAGGRSKGILKDALAFCERMVNEPAMVSASTKCEPL